MAEPTKPDVTKRDSARAPETKNEPRELPESELNKVTGGGDPCEGGQLHRR